MFATKTFQKCLTLCNFLKELILKLSKIFQLATFSNYLFSSIFAIDCLNLSTSSNCSHFSLFYLFSLTNSVKNLLQIIVFSKLTYRICLFREIRNHRYKIFEIGDKVVCCSLGIILIMGVNRKRRDFSSLSFIEKISD